MNNLLKGILIFFIVVLMAGCDHEIYPGTMVKGQVVIEGSDEPVVKGAIIIDHYYAIIGAIPPDGRVIAIDTIPCDSQGNYTYRFDRPDSAANFSIRAAIWDDTIKAFVRKDCLCRIDEWINCNGNPYEQIYENYILEIPDSE